MPDAPYCLADACYWGVGKLLRAKAWGMDGYEDDDDDDGDNDNDDDDDEWWMMMKKNDSFLEKRDLNTSSSHHTL